MVLQQEEILDYLLESAAGYLMGRKCREMNGWDLQLVCKCLVRAWDLLRVLHSVQMVKVLLFLVISKQWKRELSFTDVY
jgi:hypothetical protein